MAARACKDLIRALVREKMKQLKVPSSEPYRKLILDLFHLFTGYASESIQFWAFNLPPELSPTNANTNANANASASSSSASSPRSDSGLSPTSPRSRSDSGAVDGNEFGEGDEEEERQRSEVLEGPIEYY